MSRPTPELAPPRRRRPLERQPLLVLTNARSGSSVCTAMLGQHPDAYGFPELVLFGGATVGDVLQDKAGVSPDVQRAHLGGLLRSVAQIEYGEQSGATVARAGRWLERRRAWAVEHVLDHLFSAVAPRLPVEKSPDTAITDDAIARALRAYPEAFFLHLVRHPLPTIASMTRHWSEYESARSAGNGLARRLALLWVSTEHRIMAALRSVPAERQIRVRAEDLLNDPHRALPSLLQHVGLSTSSEAIEAMLHPERSLYARPGGGNDPGFLRDPVPRRIGCPRSFDVPLEWRLEDELSQALRRTAHHYGYDA